MDESILADSDLDVVVVRDLFRIIALVETANDGRPCAVPAWIAVALDGFIQSQALSGSILFRAA